MKLFKRIILILAIIAATGIVTLLSINWYVNSFTSKRLYRSIAEVPASDTPRIAIVFGAGVRSDGQPKDALYDRIATAVDLYKAGKVKKLLMTGDNPSEQYDEPTAMKTTAIDMGMPEQDIVLDFAGRRTYDSCYRAKEIFEVKSAILVTQEFHQARSLYLCRNFGIDSIGIIANRRNYLGENWWAVREFLSIVSAWWEMNFVPFEPIGGQKEPI